MLASSGNFCISYITFVAELTGTTFEAIVSALSTMQSDQLISVMSGCVFRDVVSTCKDLSKTL